MLLKMFVPRSLFVIGLLSCGMGQAHSHDNAPIVPVLGRTRVGKGTFIEAGIKSCSGKIIDISSDRMTSHTNDYNFYNDCSDFRLMDTVGYDDTQGKTEESMMKFLKRLENSMFYPPLIIFSTLGSSDLEWLKVFQRIFPEYAIAIRGTKKGFEGAKDELIDFEPVQIFHLPSFLEDDSKSTEIYSQNVVDILEYYKNNLVPGRKVNLDSSIFMGEIKRNYVSQEYKKEQRKIEEISHAIVPREVTKFKYVEVRDGSCREQSSPGGAVGGAMGAAAAVAGGVALAMPFLAVASLPILVGGFALTECVPNYKDELVEYVEIIEEKKPIKTIQEFEDTYEQNVYETWKVMVDGSKFFLNKDTTDWALISSNLVSKAVVDATPDFITK